MKLKPCPFCGSSAEIRRVLWSSSSNHSGILPDGAELISKRTSQSGSTVYFWQKFGYVVTCDTLKCICHTSNTKYKSEDEVAEVWNTRC